MDATRKRRVAIGAAVIVIGLLLAPLIGCGVVMAVPSLASGKFFSENDGSVGPAFYVCLWVWGAISIASVLVGTVPLVLGLVKRDAPAGAAAIKGERSGP